jgi:hypothetical protein
MLAASAVAQVAEPVLPADVDWHVRLLAPLTTEFNRKGDMVSARVLEPAAYSGAILEGVIRDLKAGGSPGKSSTVEFDFETLHVGDKALQVDASFLQALNSRRQPGVDEEGSPLETGSQGLGGKVAGVLKRRGSGPLRLAVRAANLSFAPGSEIVLRLQSRQPR